MLDIKKFLRILPTILLETFLFGLILLGIGAYATKAIYGEKVLKEIQVGVVAKGGDKTADMLVRFVGSMDSIKDTISFSLLSSEQEARQKLERGEIYAAILIPEGIIDSVLSGENIPATILLDNSHSEMETAVFAEFTRAGARLLTTAQAGIYAADAFLVETFPREKGRKEQIEQTEDYLNAAYLSYALDRTSVVEETEVEAVEGLNLMDYYTVALLLAFLSFAGLSFGRYMQVENGERERLLGSRGVGAGQRYCIEVMAFSVVFAILGTGVCTLAGMLLISKSNSFFKLDMEWLFLLVLWFVVGTFIRMLLQIAGNHAGGIGISFMVLMAFMTAAGVFIPSAFLPMWVEKIGGYVPYRVWMESMAAILRGDVKGEMIVTLFLMALFFGVVGSGAAVLRKDK